MDMNYAQTGEHGSPHHFLAALAGGWVGRQRTWLEPGKLEDESPIQASWQLILEGRFAIYLYQSSLEGEAQHGMFTFGYNTALERYEASWVDNIHNQTAMMFCVGQARKNGFQVLGSYPDPTGGPDWGWRTEVEAIDGQRLTLRAYNISPEGEEALALETSLTRLPV